MGMSITLFSPPDRGGAPPPPSDQALVTFAPYSEAQEVVDGLKVRIRRPGSSTSTIAVDRDRLSQRVP